MVSCKVMYHTMKCWQVDPSITEDCVKLGFIVSGAFVWCTNKCNNTFLSHSSHAATWTHRLKPTGQCSYCGSQQSMNGEQGGVEENSSQDEKGRSQVPTGKDLTHSKRDATYYLDKEGLFALLLLPSILKSITQNWYKLQEQKHSHKNIITQWLK